ncbi:hypothetical protein ACV822_000474 [Klebsiella aerogenes]|uniref:hypothetical protein n=1 Tax=Klebsiella TaxID=570 RepID=UPI000B417E43|nr:hypothetical protein [Klebsiella aerogenes]EKZ9668788.1 hypothetical protein [Klebsiella aerogenes]ELT7617893.1 hypothetical protein [Klebsiella aerogenes]ELY3083147.1 hypothetical protein [Klebsiella aerogenes]MDA3992484.1 hypothetical protein [Klebsiella aerogenes]MDQ8583139.1 hypothetical protein [Klebsiella aerogenes]
MFNENAVQSAHEYFRKIYDLKDAEVLSEDLPLVQGLSKEGAVQYQTYQFNDAPEALKEQVKVGRLLMERFVGVASAAVNKKAPSSTDKYNFEQWQEVTKHLTNAFFTDPVSGDRSLNTSVQGIEIAKSVINFACNVIAGDVTAFANFLKGFGDGLSAQMSKTQAAYNYLYAYSTHDLFKDQSGNVFYKPSFLVYGTYFSQEQKKISTSCASYNEVNLNFGVNTIGGTFKIEEYMSNDKFKAAVDDFLDKYEGKSIKDTDSYFDGIFNNSSPSASYQYKKSE